MKKKNILYLFVSIVFTIHGYKAYNQSLIDNFGSETANWKPIIRNIKGNTIFLGVLHSKLTEGKGPLKNAIINNSSGKIFCSIYPEIIEASKGKEIILLVEGLDAYSTIILDSALIDTLQLPECLLSVSELAVGCDPRTDSIKIQTLSIFRTIDTLFEDGLNGDEISFEEAFGKPNKLDLSKLDPQKVLFVYDSGKKAGKYNESFESTMVTISQKLEQDGYFVLVVCGAAHVAKMIMEKRMQNSGYVFCMEPYDIFSVMRTAKFLSAIEYFAHTK